MAKEFSSPPWVMEGDSSQLNQWLWHLRYRFIQAEFARVSRKEELERENQLLRTQNRGRF